MTTIIISAAIAAAATLPIGIFAGYTIRRRSAEKQIGSAEEQAKKKEIIRQHPFCLHRSTSPVSSTAL